MPPKRVSLNISIPNAEEKAEILAKADERGKDVSEIVVNHFRRLPRLKK